MRRSFLLILMLVIAVFSSVDLLRHNLEYPKFPNQNRSQRQPKRLSLHRRLTQNPSSLSLQLDLRPVARHRGLVVPTQFNQRRR